MPIVKHTIEVEVPEGYEIVGCVHEGVSLFNNTDRNFTINIKKKPTKKLKYRVAVFEEDGELWSTTAHTDNEVRRISNYSGFKHWIHTEWQEVEI